MSNTESLQPGKVEKIIENFLFSGSMDTENEVIDALEKQSSILERKSIGNRIAEKIKDSIKIFIDGIPHRVVTVTKSSIIVKRQTVSIQAPVMR